MNFLANQKDMREKVSVLQSEMLKHEQIVMPVNHYFSQGVYAREITIPKDTILVGEIHKYQQLNILSCGEISVLTEDGIVRVKAPFAVVSPPGTKRIAYAHTDCVWTTIHGTEETNLDKIEQHFIAKDEDDYLAHCKELCIGDSTKCLG